MFLLFVFVSSFVCLAGAGEPPQSRYIQQAPRRATATRNLSRCAGEREHRLLVSRVPETVPSRSLVRKELGNRDFSDPPLDSSLVLLKKVVQIADGRALTAPSGFASPAFDSAMAWGIRSVPSSLIALGGRWAGELKAYCKKRLAASASRVVLRRKSIVAAVESTGRYKFVHLPATRRYVSSLHGAFVFRSFGRQRRFSSGASHWTQRQSVT